MVKSRLGSARITYHHTTNSRKTLIHHEYTIRGSHRLIVEDPEGGRETGGWCGYGDIAVVGGYIGFSDFFGERVAFAQELQEVVANDRG